MKCDYCGHDNPKGCTKCENCKRPLQSEETESVSQAQERETSRQQRKPVDNKLKKTINENEFRRMREQLNETVFEEENLCPECHLQLEDGECPSCGYKIDKNKEQEKINNNMNNKNPNSETVRFDPKEGQKNGRFALTPLSGKTGKSEGDPLVFNGTEVELSRSNTDPENKTITSRVQAVVSFENDQWCITDQSELKSTFVQAANKTELHDGALLLLGNQYYRFNNLSE